jgi:hypothetical protein
MDNYFNLIRISQVLKIGLHSDPLCSVFDHGLIVRPYALHQQLHYRNTTIDTNVSSFYLRKDLAVNGGTGEMVL